MMYRHQINQILDRLIKERRKMLQYGRFDDVKLIQSKIDSYYRIREKAPKATIGANW